MSNGSQLINGCIFFLSEAISPKKRRRGETTVASAEASYHSVPRGKKTGKKRAKQTEIVSNPQSVIPNIDCELLAKQFENGLPPRREFQKTYFLKCKRFLQQQILFSKPLTSADMFPASALDTFLGNVFTGEPAGRNLDVSQIQLKNCVFLGASV